MATTFDGRPMAQQGKAGLALIAAAVASFVGGTLSINKLIRPDIPREEKLLTYECGVDPIGGGWSQSTVRYYIFALLFVIFDVEAVFLQNHQTRQHLTGFKAQLSQPTH